jgi:hypothetical protein
MRSIEYYKERARIFTALASSASNDAMACLYAWMAAELLAKRRAKSPVLMKCQLSIFALPDPRSSIYRAPAVVLGQGLICLRRLNFTVTSGT